VLAALAALLVAALSATGCVSMPSGGAVLSYPVTQGPDAQSQPYVQIQPQPPGAGWTPSEIVQGFLTASANFGSYPQVARQYLTPAEGKAWDPFWSAVVYKTGPNVANPVYPSGVKNPKTATVRINGKIQANLLGNGNYSVPSASAPGGSPDPQPPFQFQLAKVGNQWRIANAPPELLLTSNSFQNDYQLRSLYFFDPLARFLVPDPVYVPLRAKPGDLMTGLVNELIAPADWLSGATKTAFPQKTKVSDVTPEGVTAVVHLTGAAIGKASNAAAGTAGNDVMQQVSAQLLSTLSGAAPSGSNGQGVQSVEVVVNGKPWVPPDGEGNPVQRSAKWKPAYGASKEFYYVDSAGYLTSRTATGGKRVAIEKIGAGYSQIAVSMDGTFLAALRGSTLYTGLVGGPLAKRGSGFASMSWDANDDLWASQGGQIDMFRGTPSARQPLAQMVPVDVSMQLGEQFTALQVAPDGVRVAIVMNGDELTFGAISRQQTQNPRITLSPVQEPPLTQVQSSPVNAIFTALTWYGPDNVITLATPGPAVTEYPVSGGTPTSLQADPEMETITASSGEPLIAGLRKGGIKIDPGLQGSWLPVSDGATPAVGTSPTYPG
jgi:hypothetical protein